MSQAQPGPDDPNARKSPSASDTPPRNAQIQEKLKHFRRVPVDISIEIGRGSVTLRDLLRLQYHSIFELNKPAGANLDLYANGVLLAKGEPLIQEDRVRIKINEIVELER